MMDTNTLHVFNVIIDMNKNSLQGIVQKYFCHKYQEKVKKLIEK